MGYCYLRFYTAESRPGEERLLKIQELTIFPAPVSSSMKQGKLPKNYLFGCLIFVAISIAYIEITPSPFSMS